MNQQEACNRAIAERLLLSALGDSQFSIAMGIPLEHRVVSERYVTML